MTFTAGDGNLQRNLRSQFLQHGDTRVTCRTQLYQPRITLWGILIVDFIFSEGKGIGKRVPLQGFKHVGAAGVRSNGPDPQEPYDTVFRVPMRLHAPRGSSY